MNRIHAKHLQVHQYTAHVCAVRAWEHSPAAQSQLPLSPGGFSSLALLEMGKFYPSRAQRLKQRFLFNQFVRSCALTESTLVEESCLFIGWDVSRTKVCFKGNLEKTQSYGLTPTLLIYLPQKAVRLLSSCPDFG